MDGSLSVRVLAPGDEPLLPPFFAAHPDTTLFLHSNLLSAGLADRGQPLQGSYAAACAEDGSVQALACHAWNGNLLLEAPTALPDVARTAVAATRRPVAGLIGRADQVHAARCVLGLESAPPSLDSREDLFRLVLDGMRVPAPLAAGEIRCRKPADAELGRLTDWRHDYRVEEIREPPGEPLREKARSEIELYQRLDRHFVLERDGQLLAYAAYNASTPDCVQLGGVYTPPRLRSRGYGRAVVAGALLRARELGVQRSVLFTPIENAPAQRAYRALGYERVGDYALLLFADPVRPAGV
jgi:GNAT superfamily N-acetyltransferase